MSDTKENMEKCEDCPQTENMNTVLQDIREDIKSLKTITIKNGGGRTVTYQKDEFYQMLYDKNKDSIKSFVNFSYSASRVFTFLWQLILTIGVIYAFFFGGKGV